MTDAVKPGCDCRKRLSDKLLERFKAAAPEASGHSVELHGYGFAIAIDGGAVTQPMFTMFEQSASYPLKKGGTKDKTKKGFMHFSYCPFCGVKA